MGLRYEKIKGHPAIFKRLFGVDAAQFEHIMGMVQPLWESEVIGQYKRQGRLYKMPLENMVLMTLLYYRTYATQMFIGFIFGHDDSRVCRIIQKVEPLLARSMSLTKEKHLSREEVESILIDATEQHIERPKKGQKDYYSGKKKKHTLKTEIRITEKGRIVYASKPTPGSMHDFALHKECPRVPIHTRAYVDSGYQGLDKLHVATELPYKNYKKNPLNAEEKAYNRALSRVRVKVENIIGQIKVFKILSDRYRNKRKRYGIKFMVIAGLVNLKNGFAAA